MPTIESLVQEFLAQKKIACVGVSNRRETGCNGIYRKFKQAGYTVFAVNPHIAEFDGDPCYPNLAALPEAPDAVFILANPTITREIVEQCIERGVRYVWMHCMLGTKPGLGSGMTSVSQEAVQMCREHGIRVIPGACPNQFFKADIGHAMMRGMFRWLGFHRLD